MEESTRESILDLIFSTPLDAQSDWKRINQLISELTRDIRPDTLFLFQGLETSLVCYFFSK